MSIDDLLSLSAQEHGNQVALDFRDEQISYSRLDDLKNSCACLLRTRQIARGDRVALFAPASLPHVISFLAAIRIGGIVVPVNPQFRELELLHILSDSGAKAVITDSDHLPFIQAINSHLPCLKEIILVEELSGISALGEEPDQNKEQFNGNEIAAIFYTSGTTGKPKGAALSHRNIISNLHSLRTLWEWTDKDVLLHTLPLCHVHGLLIALLGSLMVGNKIILFKKFDAEEVFNAIPEYKVTLFMGVPTMYFRMVESQSKADLSSMRLFISGSAPLPKDLFHRFNERFGYEILERAGMTETLINFSNPVKGMRVAGSAGFPLPEVDAKVLNEERQECAPGQDGEVALRGPNVFSGYWQNPEATKASFHDGWFLTGDIGRIDGEGRIYLLSRKKDVIKSGGILIFPNEIEEVIAGMAQVKDCAVIGIPDEEFGESVKACVVKKENDLSAHQVIEYCKQHLASYKKPKKVEFFEELPKNVMGKTMKDLLRNPANRC
jgi:malonyl-CoA/methylmalonyl-CoA synthetase